MYVPLPTIPPPMPHAELISEGLRRLLCDGKGAFSSSIRGFMALRRAGMSMQINTSVAKHNYHKLDDTFRRMSMNRR